MNASQTVTFTKKEPSADHKEPSAGHQEPSANRQEPTSSERQDRRNISPATLETLRNTVIELFSQGLFHKVGIRDIAKQAGVGPQTIYKYFGNKDELIFACIAPEFEELEKQVRRSLAATSNNALERLDSYIATTTRFYLQHRQLAEIVFMTTPVRQRMADPMFTQHYLIKELEWILKEGQRQNVIRSDVSTTDLHDTLQGTFAQYMVRKLLQPPVRNIDAECERLIRLLKPLLQA